MTRAQCWLSCTLLAAGLVACSPEPTPPPLRSLRGMTDTALLCLGIRDEDIEQGGVPARLSRPVTSCPDFNSDDGETRQLHTLVTQPETGEVALVDLAGGVVVDAEIAIPGISFLPVGGDPISVVSTPGGVASFVATREVGKPGLYGLPTSCVGPRREEQPFIDVTSWPACRLPSAPGAMQVLIDPALRTSCDAAIDPASVDVGVAAAAQRSDCPADLATEQGPVGRRKVLVTLPARGELAIIDAQELLDRTPGSFEDCTIERTIPLQVELPSAAPSQELPSDLPERDAECAPSGAPFVAESQTFVPYPADLAVADDKLYVADLQAPVIHVVDAHDPCNLSELPPLLPQSYTAPDAVIATRKVAVSPLTSTGQRFVYAIEESSATTAGSVMMFDVGDASSSRTPIVRTGSPLIPNEPPDRIQFAQEAADVEFVSRQLAAFDPATGVSVEQAACDPTAAAGTPGAQFQPSLDLSSGAAPYLLHGAFAFVALYNGQIAVIDVEDLDAQCRRPTSVNPGAVPDFRGCVGDPNVDLRNPQTVSGEISCGVVQAHRARSSGFFINDQRARGAALRQFPRLTSSTGRPLPTDQTDEGKRNPIVLAVPFSEDEPAEVFVGSSLYEAKADATNELVIDPAKAERASLALSLQEPRQFLPNEGYSLTYEGKLGRPANSKIQPQGEQAILDDGIGGHFCSSGVQDIAATRHFAQQFFPNGVDAAELDEFVATHTDYVQLTGELPGETDPYWSSSEGQTCGEGLPRSADDLTPLLGYRFCELWFGTAEVPTLRRDLRVRAAYQNALSVEPRYGGESTELLMQLVGCCFPEMTPYTVRAGQQWVLQGSSSGLQHDITTDAQTGRCVASCDPAVSGRQSRVLEISCRGDCVLDSDDRPVIGLARTAGDLGRDLACVVDDPRGGVGPGDPGAECLFREGPSRFAVYRGQEPSVRDMQFSWQLRGGFVPLTITVSRANNSVPEKLQFIPGIQSVLVADGGTAGLGVVRLDSLGNRPIN